MTVDVNEIYNDPMRLCIVDKALVAIAIALVSVEELASPAAGKPAPAQSKKMVTKYGCVNAHVTAWWNAKAADVPTDCGLAINVGVCPQGPWGLQPIQRWLHLGLLENTGLQ